jgi:5-(carboxyamino)imidazole ribonucleotide synthase
MPQRIVGIIGGGQLALMMFEASLRLPLEVQVLGARADDPAVRVMSRAVVGDHGDRDTLHTFAAQVDVLTFDHELVDVSLVEELELLGHVVHPGARTLAVATDKSAQHAAFLATDITTPPTLIARGPEELRVATRSLGFPVVVKRARGGYDGRGVEVVADEADLDSVGGMTDELFVVQRKVAIDEEIAVQVVRACTGEIAVYPVVRTVQQNGICRMVQLPAAVPERLCAEATEAAIRLAHHLGVVGVLAVEFFVVDGRLQVNEIAARPHNSGHITIESSVTSQFENHLRAVAGLPLGSTEQIVAAASMVNVIGSSRHRDPARSGPDALPVDAAVHLYGKSHRPGRKLGHVTAVGDSLDDAIRRASRAAEALEPQGAVS